MGNDYTVLMFDWDDSVSEVLTLRCRSDHEALRMTDVLSLARPQLAGYQIWHRGTQLAGTFPVHHNALTSRASQRALA